jgi:prepilin-type N-terminal cleavage/methylation domain-containing protein
MKAQKLGFSLLEMMSAMTIFAVMSFALYGMFNVLTTLQTVSLGIQHFKNEGHQIIELIEKEVSEALISSQAVFPTPLFPTPIIPLENAKITPSSTKIQIQPEFICTNPPPPGFTPHDFDTANRKPNVQQLYFCRNEYQFNQNPESNKVFWDNVYLSERILYLCNNGELKIAARTEKVKVDETNWVDGVADPTSTGNGQAEVEPLSGKNIENIEYFFWGNESKDWNSPTIREWDSRDTAVPNVHKIHKLPRAMKISLTMIYNPERDHSRKEDVNTDKDQKLVIEKVVIFKYRDS